MIVFLVLHGISAFRSGISDSVGENHNYRSSRLISLSRPMDDYLREPMWVLLVKMTGTIILLTPFEVNELFDHFARMRDTVLYMFQPYHQKPTESISALHEMSGLSLPSNHELGFEEDTVQYSELNVFAGNLYFADLKQEQWLCQYLG